MVKTQENNETPNKIIPSKEARKWAYDVFIALGAVAVGYGILTQEEAGLWITVVGAILSISNTLARVNVPAKE